MRPSRAHVERAAVIALIAVAMVFALSAGAGAGPKTITALTGGPVTTPTYTDDSQVGTTRCPSR